MKKRILFFTVCIVIFSNSITVGQIAFDQLKVDYENGQLSYEQYLVYSALTIFEPDQLPQSYQTISADLPIKTGTFLVQEIKANWNQLSTGSQSLLAPYFARPELPNSILSPSGIFRIHYTTFGINKVNSEDKDNDGIPDYVELAAQYFDYSHTVIVDSLGYKSPPPDSSGKGKEFDVYLVSLSRTYGITWLEETVPGKTGAYSCYIEVDNDFWGFQTPPLQSLMVTSAHEYFHAVQVGYRYRDDDVFFMEMCSTWMEDFVYDQVNDYLLYINSFFKSINYPFYYTNGSFEYGSCLWIHMLTKKYGAEIIREIWERIPEQKAFSVIQDVLKENNTNFKSELASFGLWNYFTGSRVNAIDYYDEGGLYPEVQFEKEYELGEGTIAIRERMRKLSSIFYHIYDTIHGDDIGLIITNFAIPDNNYLTTDRDSLEITIVSISDIQNRDSTFFRKNNLVKLTDNIGVQLNVDGGENWFAQAVVSTIYTNHEVVQFFPPFFITEPENRNFINNIFPNPFVIDENNPLIITYVVSDKEAGELIIYSADGRLITKDEFEATNQSYHIFDWNGRNENGDMVSSGVYVALLRVGGFVNMKKIAVVRR